jgi:hypothetical protein
MVPIQELTYKEIRALFKQLRELSRLQTQALEDAAFLGIDHIDRAEWDKRRHRIQEICTVVSQYKPDTI